MTVIRTIEDDEGQTFRADPEVLERLERIEAKLDALTDWGAFQDQNGRLIPRVEHAEKKRRDREGWPAE